MKKRPSLVLPVLLFAAPPGFAWDSAVHTALVQMTPNIGSVPGTSESEWPIILEAGAGEACYKRRKALEPRRRVYLDLVCGADEPDHERNIFQAPSHQADAPQRALDAFHAAVKADAGRSTGDEAAAARAANQLGHSIHYLQDLTDFSKEMKGPYRGDVRERTKKLAQSYLSLRQGTGRMAAALAARLPAAEKALKEKGLATLEEIVAAARKERKETGRLTDGMLKKDDDAARERRLDALVAERIASTIALQERWIELYLKQIGPR